MTHMEDTGPQPYDVLVAGAGAAGLLAALAIAQTGLSVVCVGPADTKVNGRTVALFEGSLRFLRACGIWPILRDYAEPVRCIRLVDDTGAALRAPTTDFAGRDIGLRALGENIENDRLVETLTAHAASVTGLSLHDDFIADVQWDQDYVRVTTRGGVPIAARLVVAADGRSSPMRKAARIAARPWSYPQTAITVLLAHGKPHRGVSTEFHTRHGPCTLVPLRPRADAPHRSSLVWLMAPEDAVRRRALAPEALAAEIERQVHGLLGPMRLDGPPGFFPMMGLRVGRLAGPRLVLIGEAAHAFPPLAAQGLNLSLRDIEALLACLAASQREGRDIAAPETLAAYERARRADVAVRTHGVDVLNRSLLCDFLPVDIARGAVFAAFNLFQPLRRAIVAEGVLPGVGARPAYLSRLS